MDSKRSPSADRPRRGSEEAEIERREDREGIPGYGQPPEEVRTLHLDAPDDFQDANAGAGAEDADEATEASPFD